MKNPVAGPVAVRFGNLDGDGQADLRFHGGPDKAVLAYSADHYPDWRAMLGRDDFLPGAFGENLTLAGLTEETVCLGDVYRVGGATLEVSQPRQPCWKLARRWDIKELPAHVVRTGRSGWYLRVLQEGPVEAGDAAELLARPEPDWPVARANDVYYRRKKDADAIRALASVAPLAECWKDELRERLANLGA